MIDRFNLEKHDGRDWRVAVRDLSRQAAADRVVAERLNGGDWRVVPA